MLRFKHCILYIIFTINYSLTVLFASTFSVSAGSTDASVGLSLLGLACFSAPSSAATVVSGVGKSSDLFSISSSPAVIDGAPSSNDPGVGSCSARVPLINSYTFNTIFYLTVARIFVKKFKG